MYYPSKNESGHVGRSSNYGLASSNSLPLVVGRQETAGLQDKSHPRPFEVSTRKLAPMAENSAGNGTKHILLVEDSAADAALAREVLNGNSVPVNLHHVLDGREALDFLRRQDPFSDAPRPDLILLDINMPRMNGLEALSEIRRDPDLRSLLVVILTTSMASDDVQRAYELNVNAFVRKPLDFEEFSDALRAMQHFFFHHVTLLPDGQAIR